MSPDKDIFTQLQHYITPSCFLFSLDQLVFFFFPLLHWTSKADTPSSLLFALASIRIFVIKWKGSFTLTLPAAWACLKCSQSFLSYIQCSLRKGTLRVLQMQQYEEESYNLCFNSWKCVVLPPESQRVTLACQSEITTLYCARSYCWGVMPLTGALSSPQYRPRVTLWDRSTDLVLLSQELQELCVHVQFYILDTWLMPAFISSVLSN